MTILGLVIGIFIGYVLFNPKRRKDFMKAIDVSGIKGQPEAELENGNSTNKSGRGNKG